MRARASTRALAVTIALGAVAAGVAVAGLAGCAVASRARGLELTAPTVSGPTVASVPGPTDEDAAMGTGRTRWLSVEQLRALIGRPVDDARRQLIAWGQTGDIVIDDATSFDQCDLGVVCAINGRARPDEVSATDRTIYLYVNAVIPVDVPLPPD